MDTEENNAPATKPAPKLLGNRSEVVTLDYPVEYDGKVWTEITVSRMSLPQVREFIESVAKDSDKARLPMFDAPEEVLAALDPDDDDKLDPVVQRFLPRRLRPAAPQIPESGVDTSQSSPAS